MKNPLLLKKIMIALAVFTLVGAWFFAQNQDKGENSSSSANYTEFLKQAYPQASTFVEIGTQPVTFSALDANQKEIGYVTLGEANGYGGPLVTAVGIDLTGKILNTIIIEGKETPSYLEEVFKQGFLDNFKGASVDSPFVLEVDLDGISGATISSRAIAKAVRQAAHSTGQEQLNLEIKEIGDPWNFGLPEVSVILLFFSALAFSIFSKKPKFRFAILACSVIILGFWLNRPISLAYLTGAILGFFPSLRENLLWYLILFAGMSLPLLTGKNIYCFWLCPFGGLQEIINKLCGVKYRLKIAEGFRYIRYLLLWLGIFLVIAANNPTKGNIEPFSTIFGFKGTTFEWIKLIAVLVLAVFSYRFWCRYFCPVGALLDLLLKVNQFIKAKLTKNKGKKLINNKSTAE